MIRKATNDDLIYVLGNLKEGDKRELLEFFDKASYASGIYNRFNNQPETYVVIEGDSPTYIFGMIELMPHVGQIWCLSTKDCVKSTLQAIRQLKRMIKSSKYDRITTTSPVYRPESHRVINLLGLSEEGRFKRAGKSGADFISFVNGV